MKDQSTQANIWSEPVPEGVSAPMEYIGILGN